MRTEFRCAALLMRVGAVGMKDVWTPSGTRCPLAHTGGPVVGHGVMRSGHHHNSRPPGGLTPTPGQRQSRLT